MAFTFTEISPDSTKAEVPKNSKIYLVDDHVPDLENIFPIDEITENNSIYYLLDGNIDNKLFVFNYYLGFEDFVNNGFFYPSFFIGCIDQYYNNLNPKTLEYNWNSKIISLNCNLNKERIHRILISHWLHKNYDWENDLIYSQSWASNNSMKQKYAQKLYYDHQPKSFSQLPQHWFSFRNQTPSEYQYDDNVEIFNETLYANVFSRTVISIVTEPDFWINACAVTEKYINAVIGLTIPIVTGYKIYEKLSAMGFDTFEDIIDTEYQYEKNPTKRVIDMMESNKQVFLAATDLIRYPKIQNRLLNNRKHLFDTETIKTLSRKNLNSDKAENLFQPYTNDILDYFRNYNCSW